jgi:hypothetical protein
MKAGDLDEVAHHNTVRYFDPKNALQCLTDLLKML